MKTVVLMINFLTIKISSSIDGAIERGCGEKVNNTSKITVCHGDGCNSMILPLECYKCDSKRIADCAINPLANLPHGQCKDPKDKCITAVFGGVTFRGCEKEVNVQNKTLSEKCDSNLCNGNIFPKNRLKCYQCRGKCCVTDFKKHLQPCVNYDDNKGCVTYVDNESNVIRKCESDSGSLDKYAVTCKGSECNNQPATYSAQCFTCSQANATFCARPNSPVAPGGKCVISKVTPCTDTLLFNQPISCFTYKKSGKVVRGCTKDAGELAKDLKNFRTCEGNLCNNQCFPLKCVSCDSRVDPKCFDKTNQLELKTCSTETTCFVGQTSDGAIIRGCGEQAKEIKNITRCDFEGCNNKDFPVPKKCHKCDSKNLAECATNPSASLPQVQCKDPQDKCVTAVFGGVTFRGCEKEVNVTTKAISEKCDSNLCNSNIFPKNRVKCYQCSGKSCVTDFKKYLQPCVNYDDNKGCVTFVENESNVIRKCASDPGFSAPKYAVTCKGSECNNQPATHSAQCYTCSQIDAVTCARPFRPISPWENCTISTLTTCTETALLNRPSCFTYRKSSKVVRGCVKDAGELAKDLDNFNTCEGPNCNNECFPVECVSCDSRKDPRCFDKTNQLKLELCLESSCFVGQTSDGSIIRGCGQQPQEITHTINRCDFDGCNNKNLPVPKKCHKCDSKNIAECATNPSASLPQVQCKDPQDKCVTAVFRGVTFRGCEKEVNVTTKAISEKCDSNLCNSNIFPKNRVKCYQCSGKTCITDFKKHLQPCVIYDENNLCVTVVESDSNVIRKCASDPGFSAPKYAVTCKGSECNNQPAMYGAQCLSCSQINATSCVRPNSPVAPGGKCALPAVKTCTDTLLLNRPISCFTYKKFGKVVRGCTKDAGELAKDLKNFSTCEGSMCNNQCLPIKCVSCDSRVDPKCFDKTNQLELKTCSTETTCFVGQTSDGAVIRGCGEQAKEIKNITLCDFEGCNNKDFPVPKKCHKCDSKNLAECATNPSASLPQEQCKDATDKCATAISMGVTYRGCAKEIKASHPVVNECDSSLCNGGVFPINRIKCYQCEGKDCVKDFQKYLKPCVHYDEKTLCVTVVKDESSVIRKCSTDPGFSPPTYAAKCEGSGCNKQPPTYSAECISCSQTNDTSCLRATPSAASGGCKLPKIKTCTEITLLNRPISCFTYKTSKKVVRGCTKDAGKLALDSKNFKTCEGQLCNNECLPIKCVSCDSRTNPECAKEVNKLEPQFCSNATSCFIGQTLEGAIIRGCGSHSAEVNQISSCSTDGCNKVKKVFPPPAKMLECYKCVSTSFAECANNPSPSLPRGYCKDANDQCVTAIVDGETYRGCEKEMNVSASSISGTCKSNLCNVDKFNTSHLGVSLRQKYDHYNNLNDNKFSNNMNNNNNSNNNNGNNIFFRIINFNFGNNKNSTDETVEKVDAS